MTTPQRPAEGRARAGVVAAVLAVLCCAAPGLLTGGTLAALAGALGGPWLIGAAGVLLLLGGAGWLARRTAVGRAPRKESCCVHGGLPGTSCQLCALR